MIRRERGADWLVIEQREHARVAAHIASAWGNERVSPLPEIPGLRWGIEHHDDGWEQWDRAPQIDPANGFPREFLEMRMRDSTAIWVKSIAVCSSHPLAGIAVGRHFCFLAERAREGRRDRDDRVALDNFLTEQSITLSTLAEAAQNASSCDQSEFDRRCDLGFAAVRFFDRVSLWLCCTPRESPETLVAPGTETVTFVLHGPSRVALDPYPLSVGSLTVEAPAKRIAIRAYKDDRELQDALCDAPTERLTWTLASS